MLKSFNEFITEATTLPNMKVNGKYTIGRSDKTFELSTKTIGSSALKQASEEIFSRGYKNITKYTADKELVYFIADGNKVIAKIFKGTSKVLMSFHAHPDLPIKEKV